MRMSSARLELTRSDWVAVSESTPLPQSLVHKKCFEDYSRRPKRPMTQRKRANYLRFQRTPSLESSSTMPLANNSLRMASARAKFR